MDATTQNALRAVGVAADLARAAALCALLWALIVWSPPNVARFAVVLALLLVPRIAGLARPFDAAFGWTMMLATGAEAAGWYATIAWIDWVIHCVTTGAVAAMAVLVSARVGLMPALQDPTPRRHRAWLVLVTTTTGMSIGVLWEFYEWVTSQVFGIPMVVGYTDTIADLAMDSLGSMIAGVMVTVWAGQGFTRQRVYLSGRV
ncbi:hypothetical protein [Krasilnikovia sp. M28-CT-15]|uniref:hypothetical protein n=1 Tax=Krasilnikovia sp. M28-CT-15 TaxID=3373540 RepID=UPI0038773EAC